MRATWDTIDSLTWALKGGADTWALTGGADTWALKGGADTWALTGGADTWALKGGAGISDRFIGREGPVRATWDSMGTLATCLLNDGIWALEGISERFIGRKGADAATDAVSAGEGPVSSFSSSSSSSSSEGAFKDKRKRSNIVARDGPPIVFMTSNGFFFATNGTRRTSPFKN